MKAPKKALILTASVKSHVLPTFYLSQLLSEEYDVHYLLHSTELVKMVEEQGYHGIFADAFNIGFNAEIVAMNFKYHKLRGLRRFIKIAGMYWKAELFRERQRKISEVMRELQPELVFIDIFSATNFLFFHRYMPRTRVIFFSPMLSTHTVRDVPGLAVGEWPRDSADANAAIAEVARKERRGLWNWVDKWNMRRACRLSAITPKHTLRYNNLYTKYYFDNVPELVLAPSELELSPAVPRPHQRYLGLCTATRRNDAKIDVSFDMAPIVKMKAEGKKIVFCSFGTYFNSYEQHRAITLFITNLIEAVCDMDDAVLVAASNNVVLDVIRSTVPAFGNVLLYSRVPQLEVLGSSDVFITHGGLGSVKEAIEYSVPMIVYPLDYRWDNSGNAFKIEHYGLGCRGEMRHETVDGIRNKLLRVLNNVSFKNNVARFSSRIREKYTGPYIRSILDEIIKTSA